MAIQASRSLKGAGSDQTILGCRKPSIFPVANPPCRLSGKLSNIVSFVLGFEGRGKGVGLRPDPSGCADARGHGRSRNGQSWRSKHGQAYLGKKEPHIECGAARPSSWRQYSSAYMIVSTRLTTQTDLSSTAWAKWIS
jgi:hypothetical protein